MACVDIVLVVRVKVVDTSILEMFKVMVGAYALIVGVLDVEVVHLSSELARFTHSWQAWSASERVRFRGLALGYFWKPSLRIYYWLHFLWPTSTLVLWLNELVDSGALRSGGVEGYSLFLKLVGKVRWPWYTVSIPVTIRVHLASMLEARIHKVIARLCLINLF